MPNEVIDQVHVLARRNPLLPAGLIFEDQNGVLDLGNDATVANDDDDSTYVPSLANPDSDSDDSDSDDSDDDDDDANSNNNDDDSIGGDSTVPSLSDANGD
jgi:hypothetical protein